MIKSRKPLQRRADAIGFLKDSSPQRFRRGRVGAMDYDRICSWFGLPPERWPPDHYRLLGLELGEDNAALIEQRVHERLDIVRRYQNVYAEQATEAMNRLAQAFVCLTDAASKKTYDAQLGIGAGTGGIGVSPAGGGTGVSPVSETLDWLSNPPPIVWLSEKQPADAPAGEFPPADIPAAPPPPRQPPPLPPLPPLIPAVGKPRPPARAEAVPIALSSPSAPPLEPVDTVWEAAHSGAARRGIATKRALYQRIARTRGLLRLWQELGKYLSSPKRRLNRSVEGPHLLRLLDEITALLRGFPALLGEAGQPGYLVLALTQVDTVKVFQSFSPHQREALSRDWHAASKLLTAHRDFLRRELRAMRQQPWRQRLLRASWSLLRDQPGTVLLLLALLALNVALWRSYAEALWQKLFTP